MVINAFFLRLLVPFQEDLDESKSDQVIANVPDVLYQESDADTPCKICNETFVKYWNDENEDWMLKNAIRIENEVCFFLAILAYPLIHS